MSSRCDLCAPGEAVWLEWQPFERGTRVQVLRAHQSRLPQLAEPELEFFALDPERQVEVLRQIAFLEPDVLPPEFRHKVSCRSGRAVANRLYEFTLKAKHKPMCCSHGSWSGNLCGMIEEPYTALGEVCLERLGHPYASPGYDRAEFWIDLSVDAGIGSILTLLL